MLPLCRSIQVGTQPPLGSADIDAPARGVIFKLITADARDAKVLAFGMGEVESRNRCGGQHRLTFGKLYSSIVLRVEQIEQDRFQRVIGACGITGGRADAAIFLSDQRFIGKLFARRIAPQSGAHVLVQFLGEGFGKTVSQGFEQNIRIIIVGRLETRKVRLDPVDGDGKSAQPVTCRIDEI